MLITALVLAVIGLAALVFAVVTGNQLVAWVCIGASALGVVLLIIDALRDRHRREPATATDGPAPRGKPRSVEAGPDHGQVSSGGGEGPQQDFDADHPSDTFDHVEETMPDGAADPAESASDDEQSATQNDHGTDLDPDHHQAVSDDHNTR
jgi:hypothetical protein